MRGGDRTNVSTKAEDNDSFNLEAPMWPCPACIEAASEIRGKEEFVPAYALERYNFAQLVSHLESGTHNQRDLVAVCLRASNYLYLKKSPS
jgi:hypothetical protein